MSYALCLCHRHSTRTQQARARRTPDISCIIYHLSRVCVCGAVPSAALPPATLLLPAAAAVLRRPSCYSACLLPAACALASLLSDHDHHLECRLQHHHHTTCNARRRCCQRFARDTRWRSPAADSRNGCRRAPRTRPGDRGSSRCHTARTAAPGARHRIGSPRG
jgi:hypothetical protein